MAPLFNPEERDRYTLEHWDFDVKLWRAKTKLPEHKQGAELATRIVGSAGKEFVRSLDINRIITGDLVYDNYGHPARDPQTGQMVVLKHGIDLLIESIHTQYDPEEQAIQITVIWEWDHFKPKHGETIVQLVLEDGTVVNSTVQVADVVRPLHSVSVICDAAHEMLYTKECGYVVPEGTLSRFLANINVIAKYPRRGGLYVAKMKARRPRPKPAPSAAKPGFTRPGRRS